MTCSVLLQLDMGMHSILVGTSAQLVSMTDPFLSTTNGPSPKQVSITFLSYINVHTSTGSDECTCLY